MGWRVRIAALALAFAALPASAAHGTARMPVGFYDDPSFRWTGSAEIAANLSAARAAHASIIHVLADWAAIAPTRPLRPLSGSDPAYRLSDLDSLIATAPRYGLQVLVTITGSPPWANGGQTQNHPPRNLVDLTRFAEMLARRYDGRHGYGIVSASRSGTSRTCPSS